MKNKTVCYELPEKLHVDFRSRLQYDGIPITHFMRYIIKSYVGKSVHMLNLIDDYKKQNKTLNKKRRSQARKMIVDGDKIVEKFTLTGGDIDNIYDLLEDKTKGYEEL